MASFRKVAKTTNALGNPLDVSPELTEKFCNLLRAGNYVETVAAFCGVHKNLLKEWLKKANADPESKYGDFAAAVEEAIAAAEIRDLISIDNAAQGVEPEYERYPEGYIDGNGKDRSGELILKTNGNPIVKKMGVLPDWKAAAWRLERRYGSRWRPELRIDAKLEVSNLSDEELEKQIKELEEGTLCRQ